MDGSHLSPLPPNATDATRLQGYETPSPFHAQPLLVPRSGWATTRQLSLQDSSTGANPRMHQPLSRSLLVRMVMPRDPQVRPAMLLARHNSCGSAGTRGGVPNKAPEASCCFQVASQVSHGEDQRVRGVRLPPTIWKPIKSCMYLRCVPARPIEYKSNAALMEY